MEPLKVAKWKKTDTLSVTQSILHNVHQTVINLMVLSIRMQIEVNISYNKFIQS